MSNVLQLVENEQTSEFYPTPPHLVDKMLEGVDFSYIHTVLEPSAGKGDILRGLARKEHSGYRDYNFDVDCIEIDPNLRQILKYNFSDERKGQFDYKDYERKAFFNKGIHIVHDNFFTYNPYKQYDLIIMNPPFSNGDKHLLKALKLQERGGNIICLLNAETLRNPYTETRKQLLRQLEEHNAIIEYIEDAFVSAERKTGVEVALIKVAIEKVVDESDIFNHFKKAALIDDFSPETTELEVTDVIKSLVNLFNVEVKSGIELIRQYKAMIPYMKSAFSDEIYSDKPILRLTSLGDRDCESITVNNYLKSVRLKYWKALLSNPKFVGKLTSKLQDEYREKVDKFADYDFTEFNVNVLYAELNSKIKEGIEEEILIMFDRLTENHSYYPEFSKNCHYYNGWKTNQAHKIGKKVILPCYGVFSEWSDRVDSYSARKVLEDIEKILNFFDGNMTEEVNSWNRLKIYFDNYKTTKKSL